MQSSVFLPGGFTEGIEGPACDAHGHLYAVNFARQGTIGRVTPSGEAEVYLELPPGSVGNGIRFDSRGRMLIADYVQHTVWRVSPDTRACEAFAVEPRMNQPNDLAIAANDTVFCSDPDWATGTGNLWRVGTDGRAALLEAGMGTTNGLEVSPDERTLYVNETVQRRIWAYSLASDGGVSGKRLLLEFADHAMDGMRCDVAGNLYVTRYGKGTVAVVSPAGEVLYEVALGGSRPSNLAFGGPDGRTVYVTIVDSGGIECFRADHPGREWALHRR